MNVLLKIDNGIKYVEKFIMIVSIMMMACILFANVVGRIVFHHSLTFAEELGTMGTVFVTFVGLSYCARVGEHICMSAIFDSLKGKPQKILQCIICIVVAVALIWLGYIALQYIIQLKGQNRTTPILNLDLWKCYLVMPVFIWLAALQYIIILLMNLTDKSGETIIRNEKVTVDSVDTEELDEELAAEEILAEGEGEPEDASAAEGGVR